MIIKDVMNPGLPQIVNPTSQQNIYEGNEKGEQEPDLNHRPATTEMNMLVNTSITVRFTATADSK